MNNIVKINNRQLIVKEFNGQRVVTFKDIDKLHERADGTANKRFLDNQKYFVKGMDFYEIIGADLKVLKRLPNFGICSNTNKAILITESGYLMLVKSFTDDLAWQVQRQLINSYFKSKDLAKPNNMKVVSLLHAEVGELIAATTDIANRVAKLEEEDLLKPYQKKALINARSSKVIALCGGSKSQAYKDKSFRSRVYQDIFRNIKNIYNVNEYDAIPKLKFEEALSLVNEYALPIELSHELDKINSISLERTNLIN